MIKTTSIKADYRYFHIEYEYKAIKEIKAILSSKWEAKDLIKNLHIHKEIVLKIANESLPILSLTIEGDNEYRKLIDSIRKELILGDPILCRIFFHNLTYPEDLTTREILRNYPARDLNYIEGLIYYTFLFNEGIALKGRSIKSIPACHFVAGRFIRGLWNDYRHYALIDEVKKTGVKDTVEDLRKSRIYRTKEGKVFDYHPLERYIYHDKGVIVEVFNEENYNLAVPSLTYRIDDLLCSFIQACQENESKNIPFGNDIETSSLKYIFRYKDKEESIPLQLLPKYKSLITSKTNKYRLTELTEDRTVKEDERQEAMLGLYKGAKKYNGDVKTVANQLKKSIPWQLGDAFDKHSGIDSRTGKRILKEKLESSGGSLDAPLDDEDRDGETHKDNLKAEPLLTLEDNVTLSEIYKKEPKLKNIIEKEKEGKALTSHERKTKERAIKTLKEKL